MDKREISEYYTEIADKVLRNENSLKYIVESQATIVYLSSDHEKKSDGKVVHGQCEKIPDKYKWAVPCDFTITIFEPNVEKFTEEQFYILLFHELLHVGIELDGNEERYFIKPHDIEDFKLIMDRFGMDWSEV